MGNNPSKPTEHIFYGETPVQFSHNLVNTLEHSSETDSTRSKATDLHIAQLVNSELQRLQAREDEILNQLSNSDLAPAESGSTGTSILSNFLPSSGQQEDPLNRQSLQEKVEGLKRRLSSVPAPEERPEDPEIVNTRQAVVNCLRINDRRPLDCYAEIERFKGVARKREKEFVVSVVGRDF
ncbi:hypothetical protein DFH27DRAFT_555620 [Peziza echinospora]|nr:hypothetical protein DFH27DRAFT_555620 [Peziza echinospora]